MVAMRRFKQNDDGAVLVEFATILPLFLILLFTILDFGQIYLRWLLAEKATHLAARLAVVRPPLCPGVPTFNDRNPGGPKERPFGTSCGVLANLCADPGTISCNGAEADGDGFDDLMGQVGLFLPTTVQPANLQLTYRFGNLGFLGGPYKPLVSVELQGDIEVPFITPLGPLLQTFYGGGQGLDNPSMPAMRATLPAEDLALGGPG